MEQSNSGRIAHSLSIRAKFAPQPPPPSSSFSRGIPETNTQRARENPFRVRFTYARGSFACTRPDWISRARSRGRRLTREYFAARPTMRPGYLGRNLVWKGAYLAAGGGGLEWDWRGWGLTGLFGGDDDFIGGDWRKFSMGFWHLEEGQRRGCCLTVWVDGFSSFELLDSYESGSEVFYCRFR